MATPDPTLTDGTPLNFAQAMELLALRLHDKPQALVCINTAIAAELIRIGIHDAPQAACVPTADTAREGAIERMNRAAALLREFNGGGLTTDQRMALMREITACLHDDGKPAAAHADTVRRLLEMLGGHACTIVVESGTAFVSDEARRALAELSGGKITVAHHGSYFIRNASR